MSRSGGGGRNGSGSDSDGSDGGLACARDRRTLRLTRAEAIQLGYTACRQCGGYFSRAVIRPQGHNAVEGCWE